MLANRTELPSRPFQTSQASSCTRTTRDVRRRCGEYEVDMRLIVVHVVRYVGVQARRCSRNPSAGTKALASTR